MSYGCIIIPVYGSWRTSRRLAVYRTYPIALCCVIRFLCQSTGLVSLQKHTGKDMLLWNDKHKKSPRRGSGKGSCHIPPCGLLLGCLKGQNLGNQFCFQTAAQFFINAQMWVACFVIHGSCRQFGYVALIVLQDFVDSVHVAGNSRRNYRVGK